MVPEMIRSGGHVMHVLFQQLSAIHTVSIFAKMLRTFWPPELDPASPVTIFAPDNQAMHSLRTAKLEQLLRRIAVFQNVLRYHMIPGKWPAAELLKEGELVSVQGEPLTFRALDGVRVQTARLTDVDHRLGDVIIHTIDRVLIPRSIDTLVEAELNKLTATESPAWPFAERGGAFPETRKSPPAPRIVSVRRMGHQYLISSAYRTFDTACVGCGQDAQISGYSGTYSAADTRYFRWR